MIINKFNKIILLFILSIAILPIIKSCNIANIYAFNITDIEIEINLTNSSKQNRTFIIDCGNKENLFLTNGTSFSIFRKDNEGILDHIGKLEAISIGTTTCKAKMLNLSSTLKERTLSINNIAVGDIANPSITLKITELFKKSSSEKLSKVGEKKIEEKIIPLINTGEFDKLKIFTFLNRGKSTEVEINQSSIISENIKKNLIIIHGIPEEFIEIHNIANLQNLYSNNKSKNSRIEFVFETPEKRENYATQDEAITDESSSDDFDLDDLDLDEELKEFEMENKIIKPTEINGPQEIGEPVEQSSNDVKKISPDSDQPGEESFK